ncbi:hypothetical protein MTBBW1_2100014 [Desulfamplus magnetovallimortis]|uniref:Histidine kinase n=1 Tax=Desulfamplus magnetovallimortis TaxID=1246637 RepID=A0A1W1HCG4_9BACT|nr:Hpt domain-containing protein [Desulfamplus magnetovallimortis]SLM30075.1 hypothetical protein MTBBW1_2100014 [Desulfamplus magnetovallimortis]
MMEDELVNVFVKESQVHLESIKSDLLELQKDINNMDPDILHGVFRSIHSIKGASGFYHFQKIRTLSHTIKELISQIMYKKITADHGQMEAMQAGVNLLSNMLEDIANSEQYDIEKEIMNLTCCFQQSDKPVKMITLQETHQNGKVPRVFEINEEKLERFLKNGQSLYTLNFFLKKDLTQKGKTPFDVINVINMSGEFIESSLDIESIQGLADCLDNDLSFVVLFGTAMEITLLSKTLDIPESSISVIDLKEQIKKYGIETSSDLNPEKDTLFLMPTTDLVASKIEVLRDSFLKKLKANPGVSKVVLKADHIETVDSLGVNLIIGIYRQVMSESKLFEITGAGEKFLKVANFFQFPALFKITSKEITK